MADKSDMALTHLEELFDDLESEGSKHVSDFKAEMNEILSGAAALFETQEEVKNSIYVNLADLMNRRLSLLRDLNMNRLRLEDNALLGELKNVLQIPPELSDHEKQLQIVSNQYGDISNLHHEERDWIIQFAGILNSTEVDEDTDTDDEDDFDIFDPIGLVIWFELPTKELPEADSKVHILVTHIGHPTAFNGFFMQCRYAGAGRFRNAMSFINYMNTSKMVASYQKLCREPVKGQLVVAPYSEDGCYYRAEIIQIMRYSVKVLYIDYGNFANVPVRDLRDFTADLASIPRQTVSCSLANATLNTPTTTSFNKDVLDEWESLILGSVLTCKVVERKGETLSVIAYLECIDVTSYLEDLELERRLKKFDLLA